jgi:predicted kinase
VIVLLTGLPGTGKSYLARQLASRSGADVLDRDAVRDAVFPQHDLDYSPEQNELASQITYRVAEYILRRNPDRLIILDGRPFSRREQVDEVVQLAAAVGHELRVLHCTAPEAVVRDRLAHDLKHGKNRDADRTVAKYRRIKRSFEPLVVPHLTVDTSRPIGESIDAILAYLSS